MATLQNRLSDLAIAVRDKINLMVPRLLPTGGSTGQALVKTAGADYAAAWQTLTSGGSAIGIIVNVDFGASFTDKASTVVTGQAWVTATSKIATQVLTPSSMDPDEIYLLAFRPVISAVVPGTGFTVTLYSEPEAKGAYDIMCLAAA
jgi:hypothetical protein